MRTTSNSAAQQRVVRAIADRLNELAIDEVISHQEIMDLIPQHQRHIKHYIFVSKAWSVLNKENGYVLANVPREGYKRLRSTTGALYVGSRALGRIRRQSKRAQKYAVNAIKNANDALPSERKQVYQQLSTLGIIEHLTFARSVAVASEEPPARRDGLDGMRQMLGAK